MPTANNHHSPVRSRLNNVLINVINHRETNLIVTSLLVFLCFFVSLKSLFVRFELIRQQQQPYSPPFSAHLNRSDYSMNETRSSDHNHWQITDLHPDHDLLPMPFLPSDTVDQAQALPSDHDNLQSTLSSDYDQEEQLRFITDHDYQPSVLYDHGHRLALRPEDDNKDHQQDLSSAAADHKLRSVFPHQHDHFRPFVSASLISLFILLSLSVLLGRLLSYFFIPAITGPILIGILFTNLVPFRSLFHYSPHEHQLSALIYEIAFLLIIVRSGFGIDQTALRQFYALCCGIGIVCPLFECLITSLALHFLFHLPIGASILFGFALCASSMAVICPIILRLRKEQRGIDLGLDSIVLTSTSIDNIVALAGFSITFGILSPRADVLIYTLTRLPAELLIGSIFGILVGLLLRAFPRADASSVHFTRTVLISAFAFAAHFGTLIIGCILFGPITALWATAVAKQRWHTDNNRNTRLEENALRLAWDLLVSQLLFFHLGMLVNISMFDSAMVGPALAVLALSVGSRFICSMCCAFLCFNKSSSASAENGVDRYKHRLFLAIGTLPKASMQCQLLPLVVRLFGVDDDHDGEGGHDHHQQHSAASLPVHVCLLAVLTVPFGHLLVRFLGKMLLRPKLTLLLLNSSKTKMTKTTTNLPQLSSTSAANDNLAKVTQSDPKDNRLKLEIGRNDEIRTNIQMRQQQLRL